MLKINSKINNKLLHIVYSINNVEDRIDLIDESEFLQCSIVLKNEIGYKFNAHKHLSKSLKSKTVMTQESWFVYKGKIRVYHYDLDDNLINTSILESGDINITLAGGHTLEILEKNTIILEHKNGPYLGFKSDKTMLNKNKL